MEVFLMSNDDDDFRGLFTDDDVTGDGVPDDGGLSSLPPLSLPDVTDGDVVPASVDGDALPVPVGVDDTDDEMLDGDVNAALVEDSGGAAGPAHDSQNVLTGVENLGPARFDIDDVLGDGTRLGASDVHILPGQLVWVRIDGVMYKLPKYSVVDSDDIEELLTDTGGRVIDNRMQTVFNRERNADASYVIRGGKYSGTRFRAHYGDSVNGRYMIFRRINDRIYAPKEIGLDQDIVDWGLMQQGLILITGPTGSGKTSTLATILRQTQLRRSAQIITVEEPVEYVFPTSGLSAVLQREVPRQSLTFLDGINAAMRDDPDIILVGESRDSKTITAALAAANTGHLTFTTVHANSAPDTIRRVLGFFSEDEVPRFRSNLSGNLKAVMSQRLVLRKGGVGRVAVREVLRIHKQESAMIENSDIDGLNESILSSHGDMDWQLGDLAARNIADYGSAHSMAMDEDRFKEAYDASSSTVTAWG
jgi:twitching motility protein PilT